MSLHLNWFIFSFNDPTHVYRKLYYPNLGLIHLIFQIITHSYSFFLFFLLSVKVWGCQFRGAFIRVIFVFADLMFTVGKISGERFFKKKPEDWKKFNFFFSPDISVIGKIQNSKSSIYSTYWKYSIFPSLFYFYSKYKYLQIRI